jgi:flavin-binding protein dodecin
LDALVHPETTVFDVWNSVRVPTVGRMHESATSCAMRVRRANEYDDRIEVRAHGSCLATRRRADMARKAKKTDSGVYRVTEIIGTSTVSWEDAASSAIAAAAKSLRDLRVAEVSKLDMKVEGGKVVAYRARVSLSFKYEA